MNEYLKWHEGSNPEIFSAKPFLIAPKRMPSKPPRLLFITNEPPQTGAAGSIIFFRLLGDYPPDRMLVVTNRVPAGGIERLPCRYEFLSLKVDRLNNTRFGHWKPSLRCLGATAWLRTKDIMARLGDFKPDLVVTLMQDSWYYEYAAKVARCMGKPMVMFGHDLAHGFEPVPAWLRGRQFARDRNFLNQCAAKLCVSEGMVHFFKKEFDVQAVVLYPPRSPDPVSQSPEKCRILKCPGRLTLGFAGGLHYGYGEQLLAMLPVLRETGTRVEMFGPLPSGFVSALKEATDVFHFNGYLSPPEAAWQAILGSCDALLQPYLNPPGNHHLQYQTHFPSKLGDCLSLGLPLLITGPADASGMEWCLSHPGAALCVTATDPSTLREALLKLKLNHDLRIQLAANGQRLGASFFAPTPLKKRLNEILQDLADT